MSSRRDFLATLPALGVGGMLGKAEMPAGKGARAAIEACGETVELENGWQFRLDPGSAFAPTSIEGSSNGWETVSVPHTWQTLGGHPEYIGVAWYRKEIFAPADWRDRFVRVEFEAVFHTAHVFLNGQPVGEHIGKGYTEFRCDLSPQLRIGQANVLLVRVDNSFSNTMLPRMKSFDWTNDGGLVRPARLLITPQVFIERLEIDAVPNLEAKTAEISVRAVMRNTRGNEQAIRLTGQVQREGSGHGQSLLPEKSVHLPPSSSQSVALDTITMASPDLWHFDAPNLYEAVIAVSSNDEAHVFRGIFGIRKFEARGTDFYLNGERVSLMGLERMAGSHPEFGMAEPGEWIEANHRDMKELNCVFTRVHWAQDRRVLDFCDRNGILMQEEVPAWGPETFAKIDANLLAQLTKNGLEQLREMMVSHRNHPCIVSWGLCNEVDGKNPNSRAFAHALAQEARKTDPSRLLTYASHSLREHPENDMAGDFDFISANEYFGSWYPGGAEELRAHIADLRRAFPSKPIVISEYGWCECQTKIPPGDDNRVKIVNDHTRVMRESGQIAGAIYFDYNDYRTIVGDHGVGALRQRVHGVVDVYSRRKPSFDALRTQSSPIEELSLQSAGDYLELLLVTGSKLPAYTLRGYSVRWLFFGYDDLPMDGKLELLPDLAPGSRLTLKAAPTATNLRRVVADILRPTGFSAARVELNL
jgi:beta-galactosidase